ADELALVVAGGRALDGNRAVGARPAGLAHARAVEALAVQRAELAAELVVGLVVHVAAHLAVLEPGLAVENGRVALAVGRVPVVQARVVPERGRQVRLAALGDRVRVQGGQLALVLAAAATAGAGRAAGGYAAGQGGRDDRAAA